MIWAALSSSLSFLPMMVQQRLILVTVFVLAMSITSCQYSSGFLLISSEALRNWTYSSHSRLVKSLPGLKSLFVPDRCNEAVIGLLSLLCAITERILCVVTVNDPREQSRPDWKLTTQSLDEKDYTAGLGTVSMLTFFRGKRKSKS